MKKDFKKKILFIYHVYIYLISILSYILLCNPTYYVFYIHINV